MIGRRCRTHLLCLGAGAFCLASGAAASGPLNDDTISALEENLTACSGGWYETDTKPWRLRGADDLRPSLGALKRPSTELDEDAGDDLYALARAMMPDLEPLPEFILDRTSSLKCPARPVEAVALMEYLAGEGPDDWRGAVNAFSWLGIAAEKGFGMPSDAGKARHYYLRARMHSAIVPNDRWSDGVDDNLLANIERAGLRPYLEELASFDRFERNGGAASMILAEELLQSHPERARRLLRTPYVPALNRLLELEAEGRIPTDHDREDVAFWSEAASHLMGYKRWFARSVKGAAIANGGLIPTAADRPSIEELRPFIVLDGLRDGAQWSRSPVPVRALVDPEGRALFVEDCRSNPLEPGSRVANLGFRLQAMRLYRPNELPRLPVTRVEGRSSYAWVILPAVLFKQNGGDAVAVEFVDLPAEECRFSNLLDADAQIP